MKIPGVSNFIYEEFYPKDVYDSLTKSPQGALWVYNLLNPKLPLLAQFIRDRFNKPVTINDWAFKEDVTKAYNYSGVRPLNCEEGASLSRHKLGLCMDVKIDGIKAKEVQDDIKKSFSLYSELGLTAMEADTPTWTHVSVENTSWRSEKGLWIISNK